MVSDSTIRLLAAASLALLQVAAHAVTVSVAEIRDDMAFVKGSDAGRKAEIWWEGTYATTANGKGNFSFEGAKPMNCEPGSCIGTLTIVGGETLAVALDFPSEPPVQPEDELVLLSEQADAHQGDSVRTVGFVSDQGSLRVVSGGADTNLRYWAVDPLALLVDRDLPNIVYDLDVTRDYGMVATGEGGWNGSAGADTLRTWSAAGDALLSTQVPIGYVYAVKIAPDALSMIASGFYGDHVVYDDGLVLQDVSETGTKRTRDLAFSPDGRVVASISKAGVQLYAFPASCTIDQCQLDLLTTLSHSGSWSFSVAFRPSSTADHIELVSGSDGGTTKFWTIGNLLADPANAAVSVTTIDSGSVYSVAWSDDGRWVAAGESGDVTVYDATSLDDLQIAFRSVGAHAGRVNDVAIAPDSVRIVSGGADGALRLWRIP